MIRSRSRLVVLMGVAAILIPLAAYNRGGAAHVQAHTSAAHNTTANVSIFATGLNNPRGLAFGPDGNLYVAEGGLGGTNSTVGRCTQVPTPVGPYLGGLTARISKISPSGVRTTVVDKLPSDQTGPGTGRGVSGVADVQFIGGTLYGLETGAGCSHGNIGTDNRIFRVNRDGTTTTIANLSDFLKTHPVAHPDADDFEPDGTWYGMVAVGKVLYATEPNHQEVDRIALDGTITRVIDLSTHFAPPNWKGPTGITYHGGLYIATLGTFPVKPGTEGIYKIIPGGQLSAVASGLTALLGVAFDPRGRLYALETVTVPGNPGPNGANTGQVVCINRNGTLTKVASGLNFPTGMTFGPHGDLYVSNNGFGVPTPGSGQVVRIDTSTSACS